jgi:hypothetical protein
LIPPPDKKQFTVLSLPEVRNDIYELLYGSIFPERSHLKIALVKDTSSGEDENEADEGNEKKKEKRKPNFHKNRESKKKDNSSRKGIMNPNSTSSK